MSIRNLFFVLLLLSASLSVGATAQVPDYLIYNGDTLSLSCNPLEPYLGVLGRRPGSQITSSACWRGYIAYFVLRNDSLFLRDITVMEDDPLGRYEYAPIDKSEFFPGRDASGDVFADWYSGELYIQYGDILEYVHMGYESFYRYERVFDVKDGIVVSSQEYDNSATSLPFGYNNDCVLRDYLDRAVDYSRLKRVPDSARVYVSILETDPDGRIVKAEASGKNSKDLEAEAVRVVMNIPRWNVYYSRGRQVQVQWVIPVFFSKWLQKQQQCPRPPYDPSGRHFSSQKKTFYRDTTNGREAHNVAWDYYISFNDAQKRGNRRSPYDELYLQMLGGDTLALPRLDPRQLADSALAYYYRAARLGYINKYSYYVVRQLENYLHLPNNPQFVPPDLLPEGAFLPYDYFANLKDDWMTQFDVKYTDVFNYSETWAKRLGQELSGLEESPLYGAALPDGDEAYRFTWLRQTLPPLMIRIETHGSQHRLVWKLGTYKDRHSREYKLSDSGSRSLSDTEWDTLRSMMAAAQFDSLETSLKKSYNPGVVWYVEHLDGSRFKAYRSDHPSQPLIDACLYMVRLTGKDFPLYY